jgi:anionic cell wall polymer biosynthesis LytR-Cps2A-Psr (LCP) family protein
VKRNSTRIVLIVLGLIIVVGIFIAFPYLKNLWNKPLGETLDLPTHTLSDNTLETTITTTQDIQGSQASNTPTTGPLCGGPRTMIIEALGENQDEHLSDVIRIVRVDFVAPSITVLDIPRDTWIQLPPLANPDLQYAKINQASQLGIDAPWRNYNGVPLYDGPGGGPGLMARVLDLNFGLRVDNYGLVNMETFVKIVDAVGGIDISLSEVVDGSGNPFDPTITNLMDYYFPVGLNHLNGKRALVFARIRKCGEKCTTYTRTSNQNLVLCALREKIMTPAVLPSIPNIIASFQDSIQTDLSPAQCSQLACLLPHLSTENIRFVEPPEGMFISNPNQYDPYRGVTTSVFNVDPQFLTVIQGFITGTWPAFESSGSGSFCD